MRLVAGAIADPRHLDRHRADAGQHLALGQIAVANHPLAALIVTTIGQQRQERLALGLHGRLQQFARLLAQKLGQRILDLALTAKRNNSIVTHGGGLQVC